jgi:hypothetical protein
MQFPTRRHPLGGGGYSPHGLAHTASLEPGLESLLNLCCQLQVARAENAGLGAPAYH